MNLKELGLYINRRMAWGYRQWDSVYLEGGGKYQIQSSSRHWSSEKRKCYTSGPTIWLKKGRVRGSKKKTTQPS
jgi:hypothetical protein